MPVLVRRLATGTTTSADLGGRGVLAVWRGNTSGTVQPPAMGNGASCCCSTGRAPTGRHTYAVIDCCTAPIAAAVAGALAGTDGDATGEMTDVLGARGCETGEVSHDTALERLLLRGATTGGEGLRGNLPMHPGSGKPAKEGVPLTGSCGPLPPTIVATVSPEHFPAQAPEPVPVCDGSLGLGDTPGPTPRGIAGMGRTTKRPVEAEVEISRPL